MMSCKPLQIKTPGIGLMCFYKDNTTENKDNKYAWFWAGVLLPASITIVNDNTIECKALKAQDLW